MQPSIRLQVRELIRREPPSDHRRQQQLGEDLASRVTRYRLSLLLLCQAILQLATLEATLGPSR